MDNFLEIDSDGVAIGGVYQKISGTDPDEWINWVPMSGGSQIGWMWSGSSWSPPLDILVSLEEIRTERDRLLTESDWTQSRDVIMSNDTEWQAYRQALRDMPSSYVPTVYPVWPTL